MSDRWAKSRALLERARQSLAGGVSSPFRAKAPVPLYFEHGCGCRLRDVDGNEYIDYALAWGPLILGHGHPALVEAVTRAAARPHIYGAQHELEIEVAERVQQLVPCAERVAFTSSGSEAVQLALRLARAFTGRTKILKFEGHYHGWMDSVLISHHPSAGQLHPAPESRGQVANALENIVVAPWNDAGAVESLFAADEIAAVICEPVLCNSGCLMPALGFLEMLRALTRRHGSLLIFDEIITGFRMAPGGAQQVFGVTPDLATFGKALAGGPPLSAVAGRREILELMMDGGVAFGGTFNGNPLSLAAAAAALRVLSADGVLECANRMGEQLRQGVQEAAGRHGVPLTITGFGTAFSLHFTRRTSLTNYRHTLEDDAHFLRRFLLAALEQGLWLLPDGRWYMSAVHGQADVSQSVEAVEVALRNAGKA